MLHPPRDFETALGRIVYRLELESRLGFPLGAVS